MLISFPEISLDQLLEHILDLPQYPRMLTRHHKDDELLFLATGNPEQNLNLPLDSMGGG